MGSKKERIFWVDFAKALGIFLVIFGHSYFPKPDNIVSYEIKNFVYSFHMPLFFFLSGYLFSPKPNSIIDFIKKSAITLLVPYLFLNVIALLLSSPMDFINGRYSHIIELIKKILIGDGHAPAGPAWFLLSLFFVRLGSFYIVRLKIIAQLIIVTLGVFFAYLNPIKLWWGIDTAFMALPFFIIAFHCRKEGKLNNITPTRKHSIFFIICVIIVLTINHYQGRVDMYSTSFGNLPILLYPCAFLGIWIVLYISAFFKSRSLKAVTIISSGTIVIMGLHPVVYSYFEAFVKKIYPSIEIMNMALKGFILSILVLIILIPITIFLLNNFSFFLGNRSIRKNH